MRMELVQYSGKFQIWASKDLDMSCSSREGLMQGDGSSFEISLAF